MLCLAPRTRHILQDWDVWLSKQDNKGNDVNLHIENIFLDELQEDGLLVYERIKVRALRRCRASRSCRVQQRTNRTCSLKEKSFYYAEFDNVFGTCLRPAYASTEEQRQNDVPVLGNTLFVCMKVLYVLANTHRR